MFCFGVISACAQGSLVALCSLLGKASTISGSWTLFPGNLCCLQILAMVNTGEMSIGMQMSFLYYFWTSGLYSQEWNCEVIYRPNSYFWGMSISSSKSPGSEWRSRFHLQPHQHWLLFFWCVPVLQVWNSICCLDLHFPDYWYIVFFSSDASGTFALLYYFFCTTSLRKLLFNTTPHLWWGRFFFLVKFYSAYM